MKNLETTTNEKIQLNIIALVALSTVILLLINFLFYSFKHQVNLFDLFSNLFLLFTTFYLIYITHKNSTVRSGFYYYTSIGFSFLFFGLLILTLSNIFIYPKEIVELSVKSLLLLGYGLLAIGVTKWIHFNESRRQKLSIQANTDELTMLLNRRSFTNFIKFEFFNSQRSATIFSLIIIDVDFFKRVNDVHGHLAGDKILKQLADVLQIYFRKSDKVSRWGGEEFAILLPNTNLVNAINVAEKLRLKVEEKLFNLSTVDINLTISAGVSESLTTDTDVDDIIKRADEALYLAKNSRNSVRSIKM